MKLPPFDYVCPTTIAEAVACLAEHPDAKVLAGGQSLLPLMAFRLVRPSLLVDVGRITDLQTIDVTDGTITIGATTTHRSVETHADVRRLTPIAVEALSHVGHAAIRNAGTVGGSIAHADPAAEWGAVALALDANVIISGPTGRRDVAVEDFFRDWMTTDLAEGEIVTGLELSVPPPGSGWSFQEVSRRHGDFAIAGVAVVLSHSEGTITRARVSLLGLGRMPLRARSVERDLTGWALGREDLAQRCAVVQDDIAPLEDQHASVAYKRHLAAVVTHRAVAQALARAGVAA